MLIKVLAIAAIVEGFELRPVLKAAQKVAVPAAIAAAIAVAPAYAASAGAGAGVFEGNCAACHAGGQNVIMPDKTLEKAVRISSLLPQTSCDGCLRHSSNEYLYILSCVMPSP